MQTIAKITPADYPDLLAAVDAGIPQRQLADRYDCAPSLVARHVARAERARELREPAGGSNPGLTADPHEGSMREILEARIRDPRTSARDLASLTNALAKVKEEQKRAGSDGPSIYTLRVGTHIVEPEKWRRDYDSERPTFRLMWRVRGGIEHVADGLAPGQVLQCLGIGLRVWTPEQLDAIQAELRQPDPEAEYTPLTEAEIAELGEQITAKRAARRSRLARRIWDLRRQAAAAQAPQTARRLTLVRIAARSASSPSRPGPSAFGAWAAAFSPRTCPVVLRRITTERADAPTVRAETSSPSTCACSSVLAEVVREMRAVLEPAT